MDVICETTDGVLRLQLNRPAKKNALTLAMYETLATALTAADQDAAVRAVLIHGLADVFTSGNDLHDFQDSPPSGEDSPVFRFMFAISSLSKPVVAAVAGPAVGIGLTMLMHCDLVYAAESTRFQAPFINLGLLPEAGSSLLMPAQLGYRATAKILMLGEPFTSGEALQYGLVTDVTPDGEAALAAATAAARGLAAKPPTAMRLTKTLLKSNGRDTVKAQIREEGARFAERLHSPEVAEAIAAFFEHRQPDFTHAT
jgi:enoyl-CoA hydratase/carnithine racemase